MLAITHLLGNPAAPNTSAASSFAALHEHLDATIGQLRELSAIDLEPGLDRTIEIKVRGGATRAQGSQFLIAFAIPHFYYHLTAAYSILRNQGVPLTMGDFLGNWGAT
jgi:hypothetical protein